MFIVERKGPNRLDIAFSGKIGREEMQSALDSLLEQSDGIQEGRMLFRVGDYRLPSLGAIAVELGQMPRLLRWMQQFDRAAVVAGQEWLRAVSELEGRLLPGLEIKAFAPDEESEAEAWLAGD